MRLVDLLPDDCVRLDIGKRVLEMDYVLQYADPVALVTKECLPNEVIVTFYCSRSANDSHSILTRVSISDRVETTTRVEIRGHCYLDNTTNDVISRVASKYREGIANMDDVIVNISAVLLSCVSRKVCTVGTMESLMNPAISLT